MTQKLAASGCSKVGAEESEEESGQISPFKTLLINHNKSGDLINLTLRLRMALQITSEEVSHASLRLFSPWLTF